MKAIRHFGIVVQDMGKSLHFYRDLLGLQIKRDIQEQGKFIDTILGLQNVKVHTVKMISQTGDTLVELLEYASHKGKKRENYEIFDLGASHIAFTVRDVDKEYQKLQEQGVAFISPPQISPDKKAKVTFCFDPDGVPIELVEELTD
jgi:catechol 2,3-dioxygenase-like lactoylglutathione lyase family enzyme